MIYLLWELMRGFGDLEIGDYEDDAHNALKFETADNF